MRSVLKEAELWDHIEGANSVKPEPIDTNYAEWIKKDSKAEAKILLSICKSNYAAVDGLDTAREVWEKLKSLHQSKGPARKASLLKKIILTKLPEGGDLRKHVTDFSDAVKELNEIGLKINDEVLAIILMYSLPASFSMFRTAMESRDEMPTTEILKVKILEEFEGRDSEPAGQGALYTRRRNQREQPRREDNVDKRQEKGNRPAGKGPECYCCHKFGHIAKNCPQKNKRRRQWAKHAQDTKEETKDTFMLSTSEEASYSQGIGDSWCIDSGCTSHMCNEEQMFKELSSIDSEVKLANNESTRIIGVGKVSIPVDTGHDKREVDITRVMYVPDLRTNLLSVSAITDRGYKVIFREKDAIVVDKKNKVCTRADRIGNLYYVRQCRDAINNVEISNSSKKAIDIWHERLGHVNERDLKVMLKSGLVHGMKFNDSEKLSECEVCAREKLTSKPFPTGDKERTRELLEIVHTDICGPMRHASVGGKKYFVTFIDNKSRWCEVYFIKNKSEVLEVFKRYKAEAETFTGCKIKFLQSDNGLEYVNREFDQVLRSNGIKRRLTVPHTPQQNGVAERKNRTLVEMARCMMRQAGSSPAFWAEAINTACYVRNRCPTSALNGGIPFTEWTGKIPTVNFMQIFGAKVFVKDKNPNKGKFDSRAIEGIFTGYDTESKAYRVYVQTTKKIIVSRDVKFMTKFGFGREYQEIFDDNCDENVIVDIRHSGNSEEGRSEHEENREEQVEEPRRTLRAVRGTARKLRAEDQQLNAAPREKIPKKRTATLSWDRLVGPSKRGRGRPRLVRTGKAGRPRKEYSSNPDQEVDTDDSFEEDSDEENSEPESLGSDDVFVNVATNAPSSWKEAEQGPEAEGWRKAIEKEMIALIKNYTWKIAPRPANRKVIGNRFVLCTKDTPQGEVKKARLVAKGCSQRPGEDFYETYSPVVRTTSIRLLSALAAELGLEIHQMDVVTAYLNGELEDDVYMEVPEVLSEILDSIIKCTSEYASSVVEIAKEWKRDLSDMKDCVCLLKKSLYGLKQSGLRWYLKLVYKLKSLGFESILQDPCLFVSRKNRKIMLITVYVDDMLFATDDEEWLKEIKKQLSENFEMKDLGKANQCLGIKFMRDDNQGVFLSQRLYAERVLERFGMNTCNPAATPIEVDCKLVKNKIPNAEQMYKYPFQSAIGALMFLAVTTRPDLSYAVNYLSQFNNNYDETHWKAVKRVLRYLKGTLDCGLAYERTGLELFGLVDASWGSCINDRRSYSGYAFILAGSPISWEARKQRTSAQSSTEAEYLAISEATKEAMYLRGIFESLGFPCECITIFNDNLGAIRLTESDAFHARTKHIDVRHYFIRDARREGIINIKHLRTEKMPADMLTKGLGKLKHRNCMKNLGLSWIYESE